MERGRMDGVLGRDQGRDWGRDQGCGRGCGQGCGEGRGEGCERGPRALLAELRPNVASLGYGLFLAVNAAGVWGGVFPFLPLWFQTAQIVRWFFFAQSASFALTFIVSALAAYRWAWVGRSFVVKPVVAVYMLGWCALIAATYLDGAALVLVTVGGCLLGCGSALFYLLWQRLFAGSPDRGVSGAGASGQSGTRDLVMGTVLGGVFYCALHVLPEAVTAFLIPLVFLPLFALAIVVRSRELDFDQPMFSDAPREHPRVYRRSVSLMRRSALCVGALGFCAGVMRSLAIAEPSVGSFVNVISMLAMAVAGAALLAAWQATDLRLNVPALYGVLFPLVITAFVALPFGGWPFARGLAAALYAAYSVAIVLMMIQCAQVAREDGVNPVFAYGVFGGVVYVLHDAGFIAGMFAERFSAMDLPPLVLAALVAVYMLALIDRVAQRGRLGAVREPDSIELVMPRGARRAEARGAGMGFRSEPDGERAGEREESREPQEPQYRDRLSKQVAVLRRHYGLSARETEVMELVARGLSVARIAEQLVVSENTIRTHTKRIYTKLDVHKRQELLDLIEAFDPHAV